MRRIAMRLPNHARIGAAAVLLLGAAIALPQSASAVQMMPTTPAPAAQPAAKAKPAVGAVKHKKKKVFRAKKKQEQSEQRFMDGYRVAYALIYERGDYAGGIAALHALRHDDEPDIANLVGYASRKLGRYDDAKYWYEKALAANPNHARTLSYYGMWHAEQGNMLKAQDYLEKVRSICGTGCREYTELKGVMEGTVAY
jgi:tetratricopeptide (TPR) repeat protein